MRDRIPGAPGQYAAVIASAELKKMQSSEPFSITLTRDDQPLVEGTPYSKAAVLPDAVAAQLCPQIDDPTPADALKTVAQHINSRSNPHGVTCGQIGAFSADTIGLSNADLDEYNTIEKSGTYWCTTGLKNAPFDGNFYFEVHENLQRATNPFNGKVLSRAFVNKAWTEWSGTTPQLASAFNEHTGDNNNPHKVTAAQVGALPVNGGTMKGAVNMGSKKITNLATPTADNDAAHKKYVDGKVGEAVIIAQGKSGDWYYRKWSDGIMECWRIISGTLTADYAWGSVYCSSVYDGRYKTVSSWYPDKFISEPTVILTPGPVSVGTYWIANNGTNGVDKLAQSPLFQIVRGTPKADCSFNVHVYAYGKYQ